MTLLELKEHYKLTTYDGGKTQHLYSLKPIGRLSPHKFICVVHKVKSGVYKLDGFEKTNNIYVLLDNIDTYLKELKFDSEFYNPSYREGATEEFIITDYLLKKGFKSNNNAFVNETEDIYGKKNNIVIYIDGLDPFELKDDVTIELRTSEYSGVRTKCKRDVSEMIKHIDSLLLPLFYSESTRYFKLAEDMILVNNEIEEVHHDLFETEIKDFKANLIEKLENSLKILKS